MASQYKREYEITFVSPTGDTVSFADLRLVFEVTKDLVGFPNLAKLEIYNLSEDTAFRIKDEFSNVLLDAGYHGDVKLLFKGEIRNIHHSRNGVDKITTIYAGDGERAQAESIFAKTFKEGFNVKSMIQEVAASFGIPVDKVNGLDGKSASLTGVTLTGKTKNVMDKLATTYGFNWSIQNGNVNIFGKDDADTDIPITIINRKTGMIGSPALTEIGADCRTLLNPDLRPNALIDIQSGTPTVDLGNLYFRKINRTLGNGIFRINRIVHQGDTRGATWQSVITGQRLVI